MDAILLRRRISNGIARHRKQHLHSCIVLLRIKRVVGKLLKKKRAANVPVAFDSKTCMQRAGCAITFVWAFKEEWLVEREQIESAIREGASAELKFKVKIPDGMQIRA
eukprot:3821625-Pleurochrysis_carterae.AAC.1